MPRILPLAPPEPLTETTMRRFVDEVNKQFSQIGLLLTRLEASIPQPDERGHHAIDPQTRDTKPTRLSEVPDPMAFPAVASDVLSPIRANFAALSRDVNRIRNQLKNAGLLS